MIFALRFKGWKKELFQWMLIFLLGSVGHYLILGGMITHLQDIELHSFLIHGSFWAFLWKGNEYLVILIDWLGVTWRGKPVERMILTLVSIIVYVILITDILLFVFYRMTGLWTWEQYLSNINPEDNITTIIVTICLSAVFHGRVFLIGWRDSAVEVQRLKNENLKTQFESLKNQVNPHFLFNSLNVLSELVYEDQDRAVAFIRKMSNVYRYVLEKRDQEVVPLHEELAFLENFAYMQQIRFGENLNVEIVGDKNTTGQVPPLALQMLLENAIKHNVVSNARPLKVEINIQPEAVTVSNNIQEKLTKDSTGIGLSNLKARYQFLSDRPVLITTDHGQFKVTLPILNLK